VCIGHALYNSAFADGDFQSRGFNASAWATDIRNAYGTDAFYNDPTQFPAYPTIAIANDPATGDQNVLALSAFPVPSSIASDPRLALPTSPGQGYQQHNGAPFLQYLSASIDTSGAGQFQQRYGYWVARMRAPKGQGLWPTFWLLSSDRDPWGTEWDIAELINQDSFINEQLWLWSGSTVRSGITGGYTYGSGAPYISQNFDPSRGYHDYGILLLPSGTTWYIDGNKVQQTATATDGTTPHGEYILLSLQIGDVGSWPGLPDGTTAWPATWYIQHVRAYAPAASTC
jgi:hypothetical protein